MPFIISPRRTEDAKKPPLKIIKRSKRESPFQKSKAIQEQYARSLRGIGREVGRLVKGYAPTDLISVEKLRRALRSYSELIGPWALHIVNNVVQAVENQDKIAWQRHSREMSQALRRELLAAPMADTLQKLREEQVKLIQSIPLEAAEYVHDLVTENIYKSARAEEIAEKILKVEDVTISRANTIARTEIARAASMMTQTRAKHVGSTGYFWRTSRDLLVRKSHREMEGKFVKWDSPPTLSDKTVCHAGQIYNCRCWPEPEIPEYTEK